MIPLFLYLLCRELDLMFAGMNEALGLPRIEME